MEINILEFVKEYKENPVGALEKLEVENYVPFATKRALIDTVIESIIEYDTSLLTYEPMNKHLNFSLTCVVIRNYWEQYFRARKMHAKGQATKFVISGLHSVGL